MCLRGKITRLKMFILSTLGALLLIIGLYASQGINNLHLFASAASGVWQNFDDIPATKLNEIPSSGVIWKYSDTGNKDRWDSTEGYGDNQNIHNYFNNYVNPYNTLHMGFETYGFLGIDSVNAVKGHSLKYYITGGKNDATLPGANGLLVRTVKQYLDYLRDGQNPIQGKMKVGHPYLYFMNNSVSNNRVPFPEAQGNNRLNMYVYAPAEITNGKGGNGNPPTSIADIGPFNDTGGHWYHSYYTQGGGWIHFVVDTHPQHNNSWSNASLYPYPSFSLRDLGIEYFNRLYTWYLAFKPYSGIATPPYAIWVDEVEFTNDPEPQNNETIASPAVLFRPATKDFEISFNDKYKNNQYSYSTYEVRYSFSPITNAEWNEATPVHIQADSRFRITGRTDGKFAKWWPYYQAVWAPFRLASAEDEAKLTSGTKIYFAIKDISQTDGDSQTPIAGCGIGNWPICGRDYEKHGDTFDYAGDQPVLKLIKRIDYLIPLNNGEIIDIAAPTVNAFTVPGTASSLTIPIAAFTANDDTAVTGYMITESSSAPLASDQNWQSSAPNEYSFSFQGQKTLYAWVKDAAGKVSPSLSGSVNVAISALKPSDLNQDTKTNQQDFDILKQNFNRTDKPSSDLNQDGIVDARDLGILMSEWTR